MKFKKIISAAVGAAMLCASLPFSSMTVNIRADAVEEISTTEKSTETSEEQTTEITEQETSATAESASSDSENITGQIGDNVYYTLTSDGTLTIAGRGEMYFWEDNGFSFTDKYEEKYNTEYEYEYWEPDNSAIKSVTIENGITSIGWVFGNAVNLKSIDIPDSVTRIDYNAFENCSNLTNVKIPNSVTYIGAYAFELCTSLSDVSLSTSLSDVGTYAFMGTPWLSNKQKENSLVIENGILIDGTTCSGNVIIPDSVKKISDGCFANSKIVSAEISNNISEIGDYTFYKCENMTSVKIPNTITRIYYGAFSGCTNLKDVYYSGTKEQWKKIDIRDSNDSLSSAKIHFNSKAEGNTTKPTTSTTNSKLLGDINGDEKIDSKDAVIVLKSYAEKLAGNETKDDTLAGDVNGDGEVDSKDAVIILKYYAATLTGFTGNISEFNK